MSRFTEAVNIAEYTLDAYQRLLTGIKDIFATATDEQRQTLLTAVEESTVMLNLGLIP